MSAFLNFRAGVVRTVICLVHGTGRRDVVHGIPGFGLYAVGVPPPVDGEAVNAPMDRFASLGFATTFPVWRH